MSNQSREKSPSSALEAMSEPLDLEDYFAAECCRLRAALEGIDSSLENLAVMLPAGSPVQRIAKICREEIKKALAGPG